MRLLPVFILLVAMLGCKPAEKPGAAPRVLIEQADFRLNVAPADVPVETPLTLTLHSEHEITAIDAELTGVSMYMGKVPLRFTEQPDGSWQAVFILGACSDPAMEWQLLLTLHYSDNKNISLKQLFTSSW